MKVSGGLVIDTEKRGRKKRLKLKKNSYLSILTLSWPGFQNYIGDQGSADLPYPL
jgi:hypothetical protein